MKKMTKLFCVLIMLFGFADITFGQDTETATATATIITPISIAKTADMNFGNIAVAASTGTVVLAPAGSRTRTGGVTLPVIGGPVSAATFTVSGSGTLTYAITLPSAALTITSGGNTMTVDTWTSTPSATGTLSGGTQTLTVGATLNVGASQASGTYVSLTPFDVTVNYN